MGAAARPAGGAAQRDRRRGGGERGLGGSGAHSGVCRGHGAGAWAPSARRSPNRRWIAPAWRAAALPVSAMDRSGLAAPPRPLAVPPAPPAALGVAVTSLPPLPGAGRARTGPGGRERRREAAPAARECGGGGGRARPRGRSGPRFPGSRFPLARPRSGRRLRPRGARRGAGSRFSRRPGLRALGPPALRAPPAGGPSAMAAPALNGPGCPGPGCGPRAGPGPRPGTGTRRGPRRLYRPSVISAFPDLLPLPLGRAADPRGGAATPGGARARSRCPPVSPPVSPRVPPARYLPRPLPC